MDIFKFYILETGVEIRKDEHQEERQQGTRAGFSSSTQTAIEFKPLLGLCLGWTFFLNINFYHQHFFIIWASVVGWTIDFQKNLIVPSCGRCVSL